MSVLSIALYRKRQNVGATLKFDPIFFLVNRIIQTIWVAFSMKTSRVCSGMLSYENDALKFSKNCEKPQTARASRAPWFQGSWNSLFDPDQSVVDQKHERKSSSRGVLYIFQNIGIWILVTFH